MRRIFNAIWRIMGRIWITARSGKLGMSLVFGRMAEHIAGEHDHEDQSVYTPQLPSAEIGVDTRREAAEQYRKEPEAD
jgi:hypothetical protein